MTKFINLMIIMISLSLSGFSFLLFASDLPSESAITPNTASTTTPEKAKSIFDFSGALPVYTDAELIKLFEKKEHFKRVRDKDNCQLLQDIEARARVTESPAYQFLYGEMLSWGICLEQNVDLGIYYERAAAKQALPAALLQLGSYYESGIFLQKDPELALSYYREGAELGYTQARISYAKLLLIAGSPLDYEDAYRWLTNIVTGDRKVKGTVDNLLAQLENRMPSFVRKEALKNKTYY